MTLKRSNSVMALMTCVLGVVCALPGDVMGHEDTTHGPSTQPQRRTHQRHDRQPGAMRFDNFEAGSNKDLSQEEIEATMLFLRENRPEMARRLERLRAANPQRAKEVLAQVRRKIQHMDQVKEQDPELYRLQIRNGQLEHQAKELGRRIRKLTNDTADPYEAQEMKDELRRLIREHFQVRQEMREMALRRLEKRLEELRSQLAKRQASQERLVEQRYQELVTDENLAEW